MPSIASMTFVLPETFDGIDRGDSGEEEPGETSV